MATTTSLGDFLGRAVSNLTPGTSTAKDWLNRDVKTGNKDWLGRNLAATPRHPPPLWLALTAYAVGARVRVVLTNEVQSLALTDETGGDFTLAFDNSAPTTAIAFDAANTAIDAALEALATIGVGEVAVTGSVGGPFACAFAGTLAGRPLPLMVVNDAGLTPAAASAVVTRTTAGSFAILQCTVAGTSHAATMPTAPAVGATVVDATVTWRRLQ